MFGTLHCNSPTKEAEFVERPYGSLNPGMNSACDRCRAYKVRLPWLGTYHSSNIPFQYLVY